jgi:hypothetical protein
MTAADDQPTSGQLESGQLEVALAVYREVRAEINHWMQAKTALIGLALTATAAIGSLGASAASRREVLLILPFVLSGLALVYLNYSVFSKTSGDYIREDLWPFLGRLLPVPGDDPDSQLPDWETWIAARHNRLGAAGSLTFLGQGIVFGVPALAALILTGQLAWSDALASIWWVWSLASLTLVGTIAVIVVVEISVLSPRTAPRPR